MTKAKHSVLLGVTASIAAYKACDIISLFKKSSIDVTCVLTEEGRHFITPLTLQALSGNRVYMDMFELPKDWEIVHTSLAERADLILIAPASADMIGKLASGICGSLLSCVVFASKAPVLIAPAMNENMFNNKIIQANIAKLKNIGYRFVGPVKGRLACGRTAIGHIADTAYIVNEAKRLLK